MPTRSAPIVRRITISAGFRTGPGERGVNAFVNFDAQALGFDERGLAIGFPITWVMSGKRGPKRLVVGTDERIRALQVDVVAEDDECAC